jgi:O-methyltransferase involved in polyketide biosynthesis
MQNSLPDHSKISPTAKVVAYWRQFSDIPFSNEVAQLVSAESVYKDFLKNTDATIESMSWFAPIIEVRYKSMVHAIRRKQIKQILELASGVSLRGLAMTTDPEMIYVETDLPGISNEKKQIVELIKKQHKLTERENLFFKEANVLHADELNEAVLPFFEQRPIAIIHEGLFQYLTLEEKKAAALNIHTLLKRFGGVWMTPDFATKEDIDLRWNFSNFSKLVNDSIKTVTERDFRECAFESDSHIQNFFQNLGFQIEEFPQLDSSFEITCSRKVPVDPETIQAMAPYMKMWSLKVSH